MEKYQITIQRIASNTMIPERTVLKRWTKAVLQTRIPTAELTIRIVSKKEMLELNSTYRHKNYPTNVLSFPFEMPNGIEIHTPILGDIVICAEVVSEEACMQKKSLESHWAHMVVHGLLHLLGYDHEKETDADVMEKEEIAILQQLGFNNPYESSHNEK